jgi:hypothetical protein
MLSGPSTVWSLPTLSVGDRARPRQPARPRDPHESKGAQATQLIRARMPYGCGCKVCLMCMRKLQPAMPLIGGFAWSNHTARTTSLARPEDTKNDWSSQSLLRPLSIVFISRGICKSPWPMAASAPALRPLSTPPRILPGRDSASKQPLSSRAGRKLCPPQLRQLSSRHATDAPRLHQEDQRVVLLWLWAATQQHPTERRCAQGRRQLMRLWASRFTMSNK